MRIKALPGRLVLVGMLGLGLGGCSGSSDKTPSGRGGQGGSGGSVAATQGGSSGTAGTPSSGGSGMGGSLTSSGGKSSATGGMLLGSGGSGQGGFVTASGGEPSGTGGMPSSGGRGAGGAPRGGASSGGSDTGGGGGRRAATGGGTSPGGSGSGGAPREGGSSGSGGSGTGGTTAFDGKELFILFGQSNMSGMSPMPQEPWPINEKITFMVQYDCNRLGQKKDEWLPAQPPLHGCQWATGGVGLGLADYFGVAMAEAWPDAEIGLIPNAIPAVTIDVFMKDGPSPGGGTKALPDGYTSAYALMVDRAKEAQKLGRIRGILLHQGESDYNKGLGDQWLGKLATVVADLRADLELGEEVPFLAGQIPPGNYSGHNVYVDQVPDKIPNSAVISAAGTAIHDGAHFDQKSARLMGERYAAKLIEMVSKQ